MRSVEASYDRTGLEYIEILYLHDISVRWHPDTLEEVYGQVARDGYKALEELKRNGYVRAIGVGVNDNDILVRFGQDFDFDLFMLSGRYTLIDQTALNVLLPLCERRNISVVVASPYASGILATGNSGASNYFYRDAPSEIVQTVKRIEDACRRFDIPLAAAALQFPLGHQCVVSLAVGMRDAQEVSANAAYLNVSIPSEFWSHLRSTGVLDSRATLPS
jgi:D-threo-aldose 1-dehydrogenase